VSATLAGTPKPTPPPPQTAYEHFVLDIFDAYTELFQAYDNVMQMVNLAGLRFKRIQTITRLQFLTFVLEASYNEFYIFDERIGAFLTVVQRKYRHDPQFALLQTFLPKAQAIIASTLKPILAVRGAHVHERRISSGDETLKRAGTLDILVVRGGMKRLKPIRRAAMLAAEKHTLQATRTLTRNAKAVSAAILKQMCSQLLDSNGRLRYPSNIKRPDHSTTAPSSPAQR
jgi:hypothetical protein